MIDKIMDRLFISDVSDVIAGHPLRKYEITHVLTVSAVDVPVNHRLPHVDYHFVFVMDLPNYDLLAGGQLFECVAYINDVLRCDGNVLVHCEAGVSRSVTVVAAYIMQKLGLTAESAIKLIKESRPVACPNDGFFKQLQIYESLQYKIDEFSLSQCRMYKQWIILSGNSSHKGSPVPNMRSECHEKAGLEISMNSNIGTNQKTTTSKEQDAKQQLKKRGSQFRCGNCRQVLFFEEHLIQHKRCDGELCEFGYLVEPMKWMNVQEFKGKIFCHKCGVKLGNYLWGGRQCDGELGAKCAEFVIPWVHLHRSKIDEIKVYSTVEQSHESHMMVPFVAKS